MVTLNSRQSFCHMRRKGSANTESTRWYAGKLPFGPVPRSLGALPGR